MINSKPYIFLDDQITQKTRFYSKPIDIITVNKETGKVTFYDAKSDRTSRHKKRPQSKIQKKLGVKNLYVNLHKRTYRLEGKLGKL